MASFELLRALEELDRKTPAYFIHEMFAHGRLEVRRVAVEVLGDLEPRRKSSRLLREVLAIVPDERARGAQ